MNQIQTSIGNLANAAALISNINNNSSDLDAGELISNNNSNQMITDSGGGGDSCSDDDDDEEIDDDDDSSNSNLIDMPQLSEGSFPLCRLTMIQKFSIFAKII